MSRGRIPRFSEMSEREREFMISVARLRLIRFVPIVFAAFVALNCADMLTTLVAARSGLIFIEYNPLAAKMFSYGFWGWVLAAAAKCALVCAVGFMAIYRGPRGVNTPGYQILNFVGFVVLCIVDVYSGYVVFGNNLPSLIANHLLTL